MSDKQLTAEAIKSINTNTFDLANYAIRLARFYVESGHEVNSTSLLKEVMKHPDESYLDTLKILEEEEKQEERERENQYRQD